MLSDSLIFKRNLLITELSARAQFAVARQTAIKTYKRKKAKREKQCPSNEQRLQYSLSISKRVCRL